MQTLPREDMARHVREALAPLDCVCDFKDHSNIFGFAVYFEDEDRIVVEDVRRKMEDPKTLSERLHALRAQLKSEGKVLNEWQGIPLATS